MDLSDSRPLSSVFLASGSTLQELEQHPCLVEAEQTKMLPLLCYLRSKIRLLPLLLCLAMSQGRHSSAPPETP